MKSALLSHADLARYCAKIYADPHPDVDQHDVQAFFWQASSQELVCAVPGTHVDDLRQWLRDFRTLPERFDVGYLHKGFGSGGDALWGDVRMRIGMATMITFTGHSLGSAIAQVLAAKCSAEIVGASFRVVGFGPPRVAFRLDTTFAPLLRRGKEWTLYARHGDPVRNLPGRILYSHKTRVTEIGQVVDFPESPANHSIDLYVNDLVALGV